MSSTIFQCDLITISKPNQAWGLGLSFRKGYSSTVFQLWWYFFCHFQDRTLVGGSSSADIQLSGLGIQPEHCLLLVEGGGLHMEPLGAARCFVNGTPVVSRVRLGHADRILWGNHHFFRVNCPKATGMFILEMRLKCSCGLLAQFF